MSSHKRIDPPHTPELATDPEDATLDDVDRLMQLQDSVKEVYAEIGRLKKKVNATVKRRRERNRLEIERLQRARTMAENRGIFED